MNLHSFSLQFRKQFQNRISGFNTRELLIAQISRGGFTGFGEIAPLPGYSRESLKLAREQFVRISHKINIKDIIRQNPARILETILGLDLYPSVESGLLSALLDLKAKTRNIPIHKLLTSQPVKSIPCNALIGLENREDTAYLASEAAKSGFNRIKLKFGRPEFSSDLEVLQSAVEAAGHGILFRLDVNGGWNYDQGEHHLKVLADYPVDYIEQPLPADQFDQLTQLQLKSQIPIALDESVTQIKSWRSFYEHSTLHLLVIKPTIHGLFFLSPSFQNLIKKYSIRVIISSSFESPVGHAFLSQLAAAVAPEESHGLATLNLFENTRDIGSGYPLTRGSVRLPDGPGLGLGFTL